MQMFTDHLRSEASCTLSHDSKYSEVIITVHWLHSKVCTLHHCKYSIKYSVKYSMVGCRVSQPSDSTVTATVLSLGTWQLQLQQSPKLSHIWGQWCLGSINTCLRPFLSPTPPPPPRITSPPPFSHSVLLLLTQSSSLFFSMFSSYFLPPRPFPSLAFSPYPLHPTTPFHQIESFPN